MKHIIKITCPQCHKVSDFIVYDTIKVKRDPQLIHDLLNLSLFRFVCPDCGFSVAVEYPFAFSDEDEKIFLFSLPGTNNIKEAYDRFIEVASESIVNDKGYLFRFVDSQEALVEKISILYNGYDDRIIELYKLKYASSWLETYPQMINAYFMNDIKLGPCFYVFSENGIISTISLDAKEYKALSNKYFFDSDIRDQNIKVINKDWAEEYLKQFEKVS